MKLPAGEATKAKPTPRGQLARLGLVLDVVVAEGREDVRIRPTSSTDLLWRPMPRARCPHAGWLAWWPGRRFELEQGEPTGAAAEAFERWSIWEADALGRAQVAEASSYRRHRAVTIGYRSDKFSRRESDYEHPFEAGVYLYRPQRGAGPWVVRGGRLRLTPRGIEG